LNNLELDWLDELDLNIRLGQFQNLDWDYNEDLEESIRLKQIHQL
jgi:hypothetical protein